MTIEEGIALCKSQSEEYARRAECGVIQIGKEAYAQDAANYSQIMQWLMELEERRKADEKPWERGKWIFYEHGDNFDYYLCSQCSHISDDITAFCPDCGADMRD